jgi:hypothetical protein
MLGKIFSEGKDILAKNNLESEGRNKIDEKAVRDRIMNVKITNKILILLFVNEEQKMFVNI